MVSEKKPLSKRFLADIASFRRRDPNFRLGVSQIDRVGVFTKVSFKRNEWISLEIWHSHSCMKDTTENIGPCSDKNHLNGQCWIYLSGDFGEHINHSATPNARFEYIPRNDELRLRFLADLPAETEVTIDYGPFYDTPEFTTRKVITKAK